MGSIRRLAWVLLALAVSAALATYFGPQERWMGVDLGATGASVLMLCLLASVWLFAARGDEVFADHMSVAERRTWVTLFFLVLVLTDFVLAMVTLARSGVTPESPSDLLAWRFLQRFFVFAVFWAVILHLIGRGSRGIEIDERDLRLQHRADRAADLALSLIVIAGVIVLASVPRELLDWWLAPIVLANVLIGLLIAKSLVEHVVLALSYRRS